MTTRTVIPQKTWDAIWTDYIADHPYRYPGVTFVELARTHDVSARLISRHAKTNQWARKARLRDVRRWVRQDGRYLPQGVAQVTRDLARLAPFLRSKDPLALKRCAHVAHESLSTLSFIADNVYRHRRELAKLEGRPVPRRGRVPRVPAHVEPWADAQERQRQVEMHREWEKRARELEEWRF